MIFLSDIQGTITAIVPDKIYQGSSNAKELILIAPFPSTSAVSAAIRLPNGQLLPPLMANSYMLSPLPAFSPAILDRDGRNYHAWRMQLDAPLTAFSGDISVQFLLSTNGGNGVIESTSECIINIGRGTPYITPSSPDGWQSVLNAIQALQQYVADNSEWDYVITPTEFSSAPGNSFGEKINNLLSPLSAEVKRVLMKDLYTYDTVSIGVPSTVTHLKMVNCSFGGEIIGHTGCYVEGARGTYSAETGYNTILLIYFGDVHDCEIASCLNCGRVTNSHLRLCHNNEEYTLPYHIISDTFFEDFSDGDSPPAILNVNEVAVAKITNIGFINGNATYREIRGASTVIGVWRVGDIPITYTHCGFVDGLSCQSYYTEEDEGKAILASTDGSKKVKDVYGKNEVYNKTEADEKETALSARISANSTAISANSTAITGLNVKVSENEREIKSVKESLTKVYIYKGTVETFSDLPTTGLEIGDVYNVESAYTDPDTGIEYPAGTNFAWDGHAWESIGGDFAAFSQRLLEAEADIDELKEDVTEQGTAINQIKNSTYTKTEVNSLAGALADAIKLEAKSKYFSYPTSSASLTRVPTYTSAGTQGAEYVSGVATPKINGQIVASLARRTANGQLKAPRLTESLPNDDEYISREYFYSRQEWDYVITSLEDFTTEKLATMSGNVLVKGVVYNMSGEEWGNTGDYIEALRVNIPSAIKVIKFINSTIYAFVAAASKDTQIEGFVGGGVSGYYYSELRGFGSVVKCDGYLKLYNCDNVINTTIQYAHSCQNLQNISVYGDYSDGIDYGFYNCTLISGVYFYSSMPWAEDEGYYIIEFSNCKHINNVHNVNISNARFDYENCDWVDGDTCDGYYTDEDNGKVQTVNTDGSKSLISVYDKEEIDGMLGDVSSILTALHEGGIS